MISRRRFFQMMGTAAVVSAAGLLVPSTRSIFLPPSGGWISPLKIRRIAHVTLVDVAPDSEYPLLNSYFRDTVRYDAVWTKANGEEVQYGIDMDGTHANPAVDKIMDDVARHQLERIMRSQGGIPNTSRHFRLQLPNGVVDARWI